MSPGNRQFLDTPAFAVKPVDSSIVVCDVPVCADNTVIAILLTEEVSDDVLAETVTYVLARWVDTCRDSIVRHYGRCHACGAVEFECTLSEWLDVSLECSSRVNGILTIIIMRITATFLRAAAWPMLHHCVHALAAPSVSDLILACAGLETVHICTSHICVKFRALTKCTIETSPTRLSSKVDLW